MRNLCVFVYNLGHNTRCWFSEELAALLRVCAIYIMTSWKQWWEIFCCDKLLRLFLAHASNQTTINNGFSGVHLFFSRFFHKQETKIVFFRVMSQFLLVNALILISLWILAVWILQREEKWLASQQPSIYPYVPYCSKLELESICPNIAFIEHNLSENFFIEIGSVKSRWITGWIMFEDFCGQNDRSEKNWYEIECE